MRTQKAISRVALLLCGAAMAASCGDDPRTPTGTLTASLTVGDPHDVTAVRFDIVAAGGTCADTPIASKTTSLEDEPLPASVGGGTATNHRFADGLFVLAPGTYLACATPLGADGNPSHACAQAQGNVTVVSEQTNEVLLVSQCTTPGNGGIDISVALNSPPAITALDIGPSKFITVCQSASIAVTASDPDGDAITYAWSAAPTGGILNATGNTATFLGAAGDYMVTVTADDGRGGHASLTFPIHVSTAVCTAVPDAVQAIFTNRCSPCHTRTTPPPSAGMSLAAGNAYANLVNVGSSNATCAGRIRVIPGDAANSYIIAKLRALAGICGNPMPLGRPALPENEIQTIETWINGQPH